MKVAEAVGTALARLGVRQVFGVVGSGNFRITNALVAAGARYVATRHEGGAVTMADAFARVSGHLAAVSVHQGCGLTNTLTGLAEAAKSRTPLLVIAAEATVPSSNFWVDQPALARAVGAASVRVDSASTCVDQVAAGVRLALDERRTVLVNLPLDVQEATVPDDVAALVDTLTPPTPSPFPEPDPHQVGALADLLATARAPVFVAGRGARHARTELLALADACGALVATSAVAKGLFHGYPWDLDVSGGFATPVAAELIRDADVLVGFGCALNMWTTRHGSLVGPDTTVVQVDVEAAALGRHRPVTLGVVGDSATVARSVTEQLMTQQLAPERPAPAQPGGGDGANVVPAGRRTPELRARLASSRRWRDVTYEPWDTDGPDARIDPRTLTALLDDALPAERIVAVDSGNFMGYPSMFLSVPDEQGFCFTQAFQSIGLGLATAVGAALARPDRLPVAALGDGGLLMAAAELDTVRRLGLPMVVVVFDDSAYGAEVHHFRDGEPLDAVTFPDTDLAAIGVGYGFDGVTVRCVADLDAVRAWVEGPRERPLLIDAKVASPRGSWWLEEAFRGH
jgi:thiamine pyrophosphate-dependent acetolactate synthase large subunit-like protein